MEGDSDPMSELRGELDQINFGSNHLSYNSSQDHEDSYSEYGNDPGIDFNVDLSDISKIEEGDDEVEYSRVVRSEITEKLSSWAQRIINELGDPQMWDYHGKHQDLGAPVGECICGHVIRYEFYISHNETGEEKILGSTCIENYDLINFKCNII